MHLSVDVKIWCAEESQIHWACSYLNMTWLLYPLLFAAYHALMLNSPPSQTALQEQVHVDAYHL
jgi:hypothetical protein